MQIAVGPSAAGMKQRRHALECITLKVDLKVKRCGPPPSRVDLVYESRVRVTLTSAKSRVRFSLTNAKSRVRFTLTSA